MKRELKLFLATISIVAFIFISGNSYAAIGEINHLDDYLINDIEVYEELFEREFDYEESFIEADWNISNNENRKTNYRKDSDGFKYDFAPKYVFDKNESLDYTRKDEMSTFEDRFGNRYVSKKRYTNPYMYGYGVILVIEKWDKRDDLKGFTYYELKGDTVYQNGEPIFDTGKKTNINGYGHEGEEYPVVLTDIDYSVNRDDEHIITAVGLGFKEEQANPNITSNYTDEGRLKVGRTVTSIYSMMIEDYKKQDVTYYNGYNVFISLVDGKDLYGFPYNFEFQDTERTAEERRGLFNFARYQFLPRLTNDIHDKSVNWLITELHPDWLTERIGYGWGEKPFMQLMQVDTTKGNEPQLVSGYYQTFERFLLDVEKIQYHYSFLTDEQYQIRGDNTFAEHLQKVDGLSPFFIDKGFSHKRINIMYMIESEPNTAIGKKIRFDKQRSNNGIKYIKPIANNGIEMRVNRDFILQNKNYIGSEIVNQAMANKNYTQFFRYFVNDYPMLAQIGAYREYYDIVIDRSVKIEPIINQEKFNTFYNMFKDELDTKNILD